MTRNLKALGLALIAAFAMSAVAASAAPAELVTHHFVGKKDAALSVASVGGGPQLFEAKTDEGKGYKCAKVSVATGKLEADTNTSVTAGPDYSECETFNPVGSANVVENECHYRFTGTTTEGNPTPGTHANVDVECPEGKHIEIKVTGLNLKCGEVPSQEVKHAVRYVNEETPSGETHVRVIATAHNVTSTTAGVCGSGTHTNGRYTGEVTVTAPGGVSINTT